MLAVGSLVDGKYEILRKIGQGGMSIVYQAVNTRTQKNWAIKEVRKDGTNDFEVVRRNLIAETDILKKLDHPNLPTIIDILDDGESFVIIMDLIEGNSLEYYLEHAGAQPEEDVIQWSIQLCDVLGYLHSRTPPIIYRDMKPSNVMLKPDGNVSLIDFGTAREFKGAATGDTTCLGTVGYAAPEQYQGSGLGETNARTDIFNLGATMFHLLTGESPSRYNSVLHGKSLREINPALSEGIEMIVHKCVQPLQEDRYQSCEELMYDLKNVDKIGKEAETLRKRRIISFASSAALTALCAIGFFTFGAMANRTTARSYDANVAAAQMEFDSDFDGACEKLTDAVELSPTRAEAYDALLDYIRGDQLIEEHEARAVNAILNQGSNSQQGNLAVLESENPEAAARFTFRYGVSMALMYEKSSGLTSAATYLSWIAEEDENGNLVRGNLLAENDAKLASVVYNMGTFMTAENDLFNEIDSETYSNFWNRIWDLTHEEDQVKSDSELEALFGEQSALAPIMELRFFQFLVSRIGASAGSFQLAGVPVQQMQDMVDLAERRINTDRTKTDSPLIDQDQVDFDSVRKTLSTLGNGS